MISFEFHEQNGNLHLTSYSLKKCPHFSGKCLRTRFARFTTFLMSGHHLSCSNISGSSEMPSHIPCLLLISADVISLRLSL